MLQKNELVMLVLSMGVLVFIVGNRFRLKNTPGHKILIAGFLSFFTGWVLKILEGFFLEHFLNLMEHICYLVGSILTVFWCCKVCGKKGVKQ